MSLAAMKVLQAFEAVTLMETGRASITVEGLQALLERTYVGVMPE
jgi:hypothetical protein